MSKKLIINADDFGIAESVNNGILKCYEQGAVTDMSILAAGDSFRHAAEEARRAGIKKIGAHLALTGALRPVRPADTVRTLVDRNGAFPGHFPRLVAGFALGRIDTDEARAELAAQVRKIKEAGFLISHVDSHEHVHMLGPVLKIVIEIMREENIQNIRFPFEEIGIMRHASEPVNIARHLALRAACFFSRGILKNSGLRHNDFFEGHFRAHSITREELFLLISEIKDGITELGCHPGFKPCHAGCEEELKLLCGGEFREALNRHSIELIAH
ncbi:MAG: ChbG/HpnK family deacetylase [Candidatus Omnitrophota bacterium]